MRVRTLDRFAIGSVAVFLCHASLTFSAVAPGPSQASAPAGFPGVLRAGFRQQRTGSQGSFLPSYGPAPAPARPPTPYSCSLTEVALKVSTR